MTDAGVAEDMHSLAIQVARFDERTQGLAREIEFLRGDIRDVRGEIRDVRSEMRWLIGGLAGLTTIGFTVLGLVLKT